MSDAPLAPFGKRAAALALEFLGLPGSGLFCAGARLLGVYHLLIATGLGTGLVLSAMQGRLALFWLCLSLLILRPFVASVQCIRARGSALSWLLLLSVGTIGFIGNSAPARFIQSRWVENYKIPSASMLPSLDVGDHLFVNKRKRAQPGDIVVFRAGPKKLSYVKRVIAVGPALVQINDRQVTINEEPLDMSITGENCPLSEDCVTLHESLGTENHSVIFRSADDGLRDELRVEVRPGELFVMGDNRDNSWDSRQLGAIERSDVVGVMSMKWWHHDAPSF